MSDLISRKDAIAYFFRPYSNEEVYSNVDIEKALNALPSADRPSKVVAQITFDEEKLREIVKGAVERSKEEYKITDRPTGKWVDDGDTLICNQCGIAYNRPIFHNGWNYCPNCGAKMEVIQNE